MGSFRFRAAASNPLLYMLVLCGTLGFLVSPVDAVNKYAGEFLKIGAGARAIGMGGAFIAVADDASTAYWNPAGLAYVGSREILFQHSEMFGNAADYNYGSIVWPLHSESGGKSDRRAAIGISLVQLGISDIPVTPGLEDLRPGIDFEDNDGDPSTSLPSENNGRWDPGERLFLDDSSFSLQSANDWALFFTYGRPLGDKLTVGGSAKVIYRTLPGIGSSHTAYGAGLDAGITYTVNNQLTLAAVARDFTTTIMVWDTDTSERISPSFVLGGQFTTALAPLHVLTLAVDVPFDFDGSTLEQRFGGDGPNGISGTINVGAEYWYHNTLALRTGMMGRNLTFGGGLRHNRLGADYAAVFNRFFGTDAIDFAGDADLDVTHRISGSYNF